MTVVHLANEQHKLAGVLGDPLGAGLGGIGLVGSPGQLAQAHHHVLLHLPQPCLQAAACLYQTEIDTSALSIVTRLQKQQKAQSASSIFYNQAEHCLSVQNDP